MANPEQSFLSRNLQKIAAVAGIVGALATIVAIFVSSSNDNSKTTTDNSTTTTVTQSTGTGAVAVGPGSTVGDVTTEIHGKSEHQEAIEKLRSAEAQCKARYHQFEGVPIERYLTEVMLLPVDAKVDRVAYGLLKGKGAMDDLVRFHDSQIRVIQRAVSSRGALRFTGLDTMITEVEARSRINLGLDIDKIEEEREERKQRSIDEWERRNPLVTELPRLEKKWGPNYSYQFNADFPKDNPATDSDETGEFLKSEFLKLFSKFCDRLAI